MDTNPTAPYTRAEVEAKLGLNYRSLKTAVDAGDVPTCFKNRPGKPWPKPAKFPRAAIDRIASEGYKTEAVR